ncbi:PEP/pyruvate-binding domain-containing protein [Melittangium boletus]|uniref:PEP/pyruvate-binding domain-containing protein n=1 Tax=Melittangium boletus TaxID=83453 RepID=UPI003DA64193
MSVVSLQEALSEEEFGGKAVQLGAALRARLTVPPGFALSVRQVNEIAAGQPEAVARVRGLLEQVGPSVAVRSSAVGEDSANASFAGQHLTALAVRTQEGLVEAVKQVWASGRTEAALGYRRKMGRMDEPRVAVVVQRLVAAECAGVLFSCDPLTGADERVIEATWGLGEAVVAGLVTPDRYRISREGHILERSAGDKDVAILPLPEGGTKEVAVAPERVHALCLDDARLQALHALATRCEAHFGGRQDLEFAFVGEDLYLLQRRAVTRVG